MNNITTIDDHVILPHQADWNAKPELRRLWRAAVESSLGGNEDRLSVRSVAWMRFSYSVFPVNQVERARLEERLREGIKAGKIAVPLWGRGVPLSAAVSAGATSVTLTRSNHNFEAGKHVLIQPSVPMLFDEWDAAVIDSVDGATLNLTEALDNGYAKGTYVWPLLFGKPTPEEFSLLNRGRGRFPVSVQFDGRQINALADESFSTYAIGPATGLNGPEGWAGEWTFGQYAA